MKVLTCVEGETVPKKRRSLAFGFLEITLGLTGAFSPIVAYSFLANGSWRPIFWLPFALNIIAFVLVFFFYRPMNQYIKEEGKTRWDQLKETDWLGNTLFIGGVVLFLVGLSFGGTTFPWYAYAPSQVRQHTYMVTGNPPVRLCRFC